MISLHAFVEAPSSSNSKAGSKAFLSRENLSLQSLDKDLDLEFLLFPALKQKPSRVPFRWKDRFRNPEWQNKIEQTNAQSLRGWFGLCCCGRLCWWFVWLEVGCLLGAVLLSQFRSAAASSC
jgi:hypothetical protein